MSGGVKGATAGTLAFMVGGDDDAVERARPVLEPMAGKIIHCGGSGTGQAAKLCNNMVLAVQQIAVGEAFVLAEKLGLSAQSLFDVITGATGNCWAVHTNCPVPGPVPTSPANNDFKPGFATALMNKDLGLAMAAVDSTGSTAPLGSHAAEIYAKFAADHADKDFSAVIELLRRGKPLPRVTGEELRRRLRGVPWPDGWPPPSIWRNSTGPPACCQRAAIAGAEMMSLGPPRPTIGPPLNGTTGSAVPCVSSTATGRDGAHPTFTPRVPATGAMAAKTSARSQASRLTMNAPADIPVANTCPGSTPKSETSLATKPVMNPTSSIPWWSGTEAPRPSAQLKSTPSG